MTSEENVTLRYPSLRESLDSLPSTVDLLHMMDERKQVSQEPTCRKDTNSKRLVVAIDTCHQKHIPLLQEVEACGEVRFVDRICRSGVDLTNEVHEILPTHLITETDDQGVCRRTFNFLKTMAVGLAILDTSWIFERDEGGWNKVVWGDSDIFSHVARVIEHQQDSPYSWLRSADWWGTDYGPCLSSLKRRMSGKDHFLLNDFSIHILQSDVSWSLLQPEDFELLCSLAGASEVILFKSEKVTIEKGCNKMKILLVSNNMTKKDLLGLANAFDKVVVHRIIASGFAVSEANEAIVVKESWLIDSIASNTVAPFWHFGLGVLTFPT